MEQNEIRDVVLHTLGEIAPDADLSSVDESITFHDQFDIDSVDFLNLMLSLERGLGVHIPQADYPKLSTLGGSVAYLSGLSAASSPHSAS